MTLVKDQIIRCVTRAQLGQTLSGESVLQLELADLGRVSVQVKLWRDDGQTGCFIEGVVTGKSDHSGKPFNAHLVYEGNDTPCDDEDEDDECSEYFPIGNQIVISVA